LTFKTNDQNNTIEIITEQGNYCFAYINGEEFPNTPNIENSEKSSVPAKILELAINNTLFATSNDELRPVMCGILCEINHDNILFVATDAHKLVKYQHTIDSPLSTSFILPKKPLQIIKNIVNKTDELVIIKYNKSNVIFAFNNMDLYCRLIDGNYPNYHAVIPKESPNTLNIDRLSLLNSLKRVSIFSNQSTNQIKFEIKGNELFISGEDIDFSNKAKERLTCQYEGNDMEIGFNGKFIIDILNTLQNERVDIFLSSPSKAAVIKPETDNTEEKENILMLVMPVMLQKT
jgi:DNA polymerase-3 subunit beta